MADKIVDGIVKKLYGDDPHDDPNTTIQIFRHDPYAFTVLVDGEERYLGTSPQDAADQALCAIEAITGLTNTGRFI